MKLTFTLDNETIRQCVIARVRAAKSGWRVTIEESKRSDEASERFWAALRHFASATDHHGEKLPAETWRDIFLHALGRETKFVRALDGEGIIPTRISTRSLTKKEMSDLTELVYSEGAKRGIVFYEPRLDPDWIPKRAGKAA
jgi:hypothetical protein